MKNETLTVVKALEVDTEISTSTVIQEHRKVKLRILNVELYRIKWFDDKKVQSTYAVKTCTKYTAHLGRRGYEDIYLHCDLFMIREKHLQC